ncbi:MAG TPA: 4-hydroxythreonine-4-phosphate dehydrogenase PdxA [Burkholderiales bacterium]|nr:4-hydroxythreonine-4-phosphate dehydrogenase PdxA [Burkholderiales bacterium]
MSKPHLAFFVGDPNGVGPELAAKLLARPETRAAAEVTIFGDARLLPAGSTFEAIPGLGDSALTPGKVNPAAGRWVVDGLTRVARAAREKHVDGIVFAPLNKQAMKLGGLKYDDEQHLFAALLDAKGYTVEFNVIDRLWTSRVTSHIPLKDVAGAISAKGVQDAVRIIHQALRRGGTERPRVAVAGLNPHAGEGGTMGREEIEIIAPAVAELKAQGIDARGPFPADTVFLAAKRGDFDAVVTMYHDQGQIAMKLMGFDRGVTVLGGLPVPIATCAHGTAYDIVGKNCANPVPLYNAFGLAARMAIHQEEQPVRVQ